MWIKHKLIQLIKRSLWSKLNKRAEQCEKLKFIVHLLLLYVWMSDDIAFLRSVNDLNERFSWNGIKTEEWRENLEMWFQSKATNKRKEILFNWQKNRFLIFSFFSSLCLEERTNERDGYASFQSVVIFLIARKLNFNGFPFFLPSLFRSFLPGARFVSLHDFYFFIFFWVASSTSNSVSFVIF